MKGGERLWKSASRYSKGASRAKFGRLYAAFVSPDFPKLDFADEA